MSLNNYLSSITDFQDMKINYKNKNFYCTFLHLIHDSPWGRDFAKSLTVTVSLCVPKKDGVLAGLWFCITIKDKDLVDNSCFCTDTIVNCLTF